MRSEASRFDDFPDQPAGYRGKRALDLVLASILLLIAIPVLVVIWVVSKLTLGSPVLFRQQRAGWRGEAFEMIKFRTMVDIRDDAGEFLPDEVRLTRIGRILRRWSIDELPELVNVIRGEMSLVGPRPLCLRYLPYYREWERTRLAARPGITGLAQISGRTLLPWDERLALDVQYVAKASLALDLRILGQTLTAALMRTGGSADSLRLEPPLDEQRS